MASPVKDVHIQSVKHVDDSCDANKHDTVVVVDASVRKICAKYVFDDCTRLDYNKKAMLVDASTQTDVNDNVIQTHVNMTCNVDMSLKRKRQHGNEYLTHCGALSHACGAQYPVCNSKKFHSVIL